MKRSDEKIGKKAGVLRKKLDKNLAVLEKDLGSLNCMSEEPALATN